MENYVCQQCQAKKPPKPAPRPRKQPPPKCKQPKQEQNPEALLELDLLPDVPNPALLARAASVGTIHAGCHPLASTPHQALTGFGTAHLRRCAPLVLPPFPEGFQDDDAWTRNLARVATAASHPAGGGAAAELGPAFPLQRSVSAHGWPGVRAAADDGGSVGWLAPSTLDGLTAPVDAPKSFGSADFTLLRKAVGLPPVDPWLPAGLPAGLSNVASMPGDGCIVAGAAAAAADFECTSIALHHTVKPATAAAAAGTAAAITSADGSLWQPEHGRMPSAEPHLGPRRSSCGSLVLMPVTPAGHQQRPAFDCVAVAAAEPHTGSFGGDRPAMRLEELQERARLAVPNMEDSDDEETAAFREQVSLSVQALCFSAEIAILPEVAENVKDL